MNQRLSEILKYNGYSLTIARSSVFSALESEHDPIEMGKLVKKVESSVDRVTVYRIVEIFQKIGVITRIQVGWKYKLELSDNFKTHHHHITCKVCGKIEDFHETTILLKELEKISNSKNFNLITHSLELSGVCKICK